MADSTNGTSTTLPPPESSILRRRHSIATSVVAANKHSPQATAPYRTTSLDSGTRKSPVSSYVSLKDVLPSYQAAMHSPTAAGSGYEVSIRNPLVKQIAMAYLLPVSVSPRGSSASHFLRGLWRRLSSATSRFSFLYDRLVTGCSRIFNQILNAFGGQVHT